MAQIKLMVTGVEAQVCKDIGQRQQLGISKYGVTVEDNPLPPEQWLQHLYEELLDASVYIKKILVSLDSIKDDGK